MTQARTGAASLRILHVDDDATNLLVLQHMLTALGHAPSGASSGAQALAHLAEEPFDLVITDIHMPNMDGPALLAAIRDLPGPASEIPVVAVTADVMTRFAEDYRDLGFAAAISKPLLTAPLVAILEAATLPSETRTFAAKGLARA